MPDSTLPPCGIGGSSVSGGPCSGTYTASQAGQDAFSQVDKVPVVSALISAGVIIAAVLFVLFMVRKVAGFFGGAPMYVGGEPGTMEHDDNFWAARGNEANASRSDAELLGEVAMLGYEDDSEDDAECDDPDADKRAFAEEHAQAGDMTDEEYDAFEWREEYRREHEGDA